MDEWLTTQEAQDITGVSRTTLYIWRLSGRVRSQMVGRTPLYYRADCEQIAKEKEQAETKEEGGKR